MDILTVELLSIPFGLLIGPATVISNITKAICDVAKIIFYQYQTYGQRPSNDLVDWQARVKVWLYETDLTDPQRGPAMKVLSQEYDMLSDNDKKFVSLSNQKNQLARHVSFIGIGIIRTIPIIGGLMRALYEIDIKAKFVRTFLNSIHASALVKSNLESENSPP